MHALGRLGFRLVREGEHIAKRRRNLDGNVTPLTLPNHSTLKESTLRTICTQGGIARDDCHRKPLRPNPVAQYRLRVGNLRVYHDVQEDPSDSSSSGPWS